MTLLASALSLILPVVGSSDRQPSAPASAPFMGVEVRELELHNGFRILVVEDHRVPRIAASLSYRLGSMQEPDGEHGSTHFLEHAVHQGTTTVGTNDFEAERPILKEIYETEQKLLAVRNRERARWREQAVFFDELDWPTTPELEQLRRRLYELEDQDDQYREFWAEYNWYQRYGGIGRHTDPVPAGTWFEHIDIEIDLPKETIELFFRLEADRMANAVFRGWEAQRFTVLEQALNGRQRLDGVGGRFYEAINGVTGIAHPLYRSVVGHLRDFAYFNRASMLRMYDEYFLPNNARLALVGDITFGQARALAERYFGQIPRGSKPPARMDLEAEPVPGGAIRLDWLEPIDPRVIVRYRIPGVGHADRPVFDTIAALLRGRHGMLGAKLMEGSALASFTDVHFQGPPSPFGWRYGSPSTINLIAMGRRDEDLPALERELLEVVQALRQGRVDPLTLERARKALRLEWRQIHADRARFAYEVGSFYAIDSWSSLQPYMDARQRAPAEEIQRVAQQYFIPSNRVIVTARRRPRPDIAPAGYEQFPRDGGRHEQGRGY